MSREQLEFLTKVLAMECRGEVLINFVATTAEGDLVVEYIDWDGGGEDWGGMVRVKVIRYKK